jgi:HD-like signal output (HDOD) protein/CheY-like chemotaxis protein
MYSCMLLSNDNPEADGIAKGLEPHRVTVIRSRPSYANYIKTLQYLPDLIVMELPRSHADELNYLQMVKQNRMVRDIPVICYGVLLSQPVQEGLKKIGVGEYVRTPLHIPGFIAALLERLKKRKAQKPRLSEPKSAAVRVEDKEIASYLLSPKISGSKKVSYFCDSVSTLLAFPFSVSIIMKMTESCDTSASDLSRAIASDPVLSAKMLQMSNSAYFGGGRNRVSSIKDAVVRIGFAETRRIAMSMSIMNLFDNERLTVGFNRLQFWRHCLSTAVMAAFFATGMRGVKKDEAFVCGLLHDFGIIVLDEFAPAVFSRLLTLTTDTGAHFIDKEREITGITHQEIIKALFEKWNIPPHLTSAVTGYGSVRARSECPAENDWQLAVCVAHANQFSKALMLGAGCDQFVVPLPVWTWERLGCASGLAQSAVTKITSEFNQYQELMGIRVETNEAAAQPAQELSVIGFLRHDTTVCSPAMEYLRARGQAVEAISLTQDMDVHSGRFDLFVLETGRSLRPEEVRALSSVIARQRGEGSGNPVKIPLVVIAPRECRFQIPPDCGRCSFLYHEFDLRNLDLSIGLLRMEAPDQPVSKARSEGAAVPGNREVFPRINSLLAEADLLLSSCQEKRLVSPELKQAAALIDSVRKGSLQEGGGDSDFEAALKTAILYCRHALLQDELRHIEQGIQALEEKGNEKQGA